MRVRLSNFYGREPLAIGSVHVAIVAAPPDVLPTSDRVVTFSGSAGVSLAPGTEAYSDPVDLAVAGRSALAVSVYIPGRFAAHTEHSLARDAFISPAGDHAGMAVFPVASKVQHVFFVTAIDVLAKAPARAIVALGDSITDLTNDAGNHRWSDFLASRLDARQAGTHDRIVAVANAGIAGNEVADDVGGDSMLKRFERDVLSQSGVGYVIVLGGINDIGFSHGTVKAERIITGYQELIRRAHAKGLKIYGGTLTPFGGSNNPVSQLVNYYSDAGEHTRQSLNTWIHSSGAFDGVLDFDKALRDHGHPSHLLPHYDSGDRLHPSDVGFQQMASIINLSWFR